MIQWSLRISAYAERLLTGLENIDWSDSLKEAQRNWIGKSEGCSLKFHSDNIEIEVFTTRPDTIFGVTYLAVAPEHPSLDLLCINEFRSLALDYTEKAKNRSERERQAEVKNITGAFTGSYAKHPFTNEAIPIWIADYVLGSYGTGAVMAVPAHDSRDYSFAKYFNLPIKEVVSGGDISKESFDAKTGNIINSDFLNGLSVKEGIKRSIQEIESLNLGKGKTNYRLRDAVFGRQRYWGEPIPIFYENGIIDTMNKKTITPKIAIDLKSEREYYKLNKKFKPLSNILEFDYDGEPINEI
jgi:leucyl-tRNA synthetase